MSGAKSQSKQEWVWAMATVIGLHQGLKYKGNTRLGIIGGLSTLLVICGVNGIYCIVGNWKTIKDIIKE